MFNKDCVMPVLLQNIKYSNMLPVDIMSLK